MRFTSILASAVLAATAIATPSTLEARQFPPPIDLAVFSEPDCQGEVFFYPELEDNVFVPQSFPVQSVRLETRSLAPWEKLEFSGRFCRTVISSLPPNTTPGCYPVDNAECLRLTRP